MAEGGEESVEAMLMQVQLLELQAQRMESLVAQRRQERAEMEAENARIERQVRYMKEMARENEEAEAEYARKQEELLAKHAPFSGQGHSLTAPSPTPATPTAVSHAHWSPVTLDPAKPSGNIQVRLAEGGRMVIKLNTDHTVAHIKQEIMARDQEQTRRPFSILSLGPPSKVLPDTATIAGENLLGSAVIQRLQ